jgi:hypothetical protein
MSVVPDIARSPMRVESSWIVVMARSNQKRRAAGHRGAKR